MSGDAAALGEFIRARRDRLTPAQAGMAPFPGARRVPGLRREELATLAGLSADYLRRVEQGRQLHVSQQVLKAIARALRLDDAERAHLMRLAEPRLTRSPTGADRLQPLDPGLARMMQTLERVPALVLGRRGEILARTQLMPLVLGAPLPLGANFIWWLLTDRDARTRIANWSDFAAASVAAIRGEISRHPGDHRLRQLVDELRTGDLEIARWWDDYSVRDYGSVRKHIQHPLFGLMEFDIELLTAPHNPDQRLIVYTCKPNSRTAEALINLVNHQNMPTIRT